MAAGDRVAAEVTPYVNAAVAAYGAAPSAEAQDGVADATVQLGWRLLRRIFEPRNAEEDLAGSLTALATDPGDGDALAGVRFAIRQALQTDPALESEVQSMLAGAAGVTQHIHAGRDASVAGRDQIVMNYRRLAR